MRLSNRRLAGRQQSTARHQVRAGGDNFSHQCVDIAVDCGISGKYVIRRLRRAAIFLALHHGIRHILAARPLDAERHNGSFTDIFRDERLNRQWSETQQQAGSAVAGWQQD